MLSINFCRKHLVGSSNRVQIGFSRTSTSVNYLSSCLFLLGVTVFKTVMTSCTRNPEWGYKINVPAQIKFAQIPFAAYFCPNPSPILTLWFHAQFPKSHLPDSHFPRVFFMVLYLY